MPIDLNAELIPRVNVSAAGHHRGHVLLAGERQN